MKLWKFTYRGYYPVGACGVVLARDEERARLFAEVAIREHGQEPRELKVELLTDTLVISGGWVLLDGNY